MKKIIEVRDADQLSDFLCKVGLINCKAGYKGKIDHFDILFKRFKQNIFRRSPNQLGKFLENTNRIMNFPQPDLEEIARLRTIVLTGKYDEFTSSDDCKKVARQFQSCDLEIVPKSDHMFMHQQPLYSAGKIDAFIRCEN